MTVPAPLTAKDQGNLRTGRHGRSDFTGKTDVKAASRRQTRPRTRKSLLGERKRESGDNCLAKHQRHPTEGMTLSYHPLIEQRGAHQEPGGQSEMNQRSENEVVEHAAHDVSATGTISVRDIGKDFGEITALKHVHLEIERGELFGLLGPNGAGKTTLISILGTMLPPSYGTAKVSGYDVRLQQNQVRRSIGIVFQDSTLDDELTGEENLDIHGRLYGMRHEVRRSRLDEVLELVDLDQRRNDFVKTYSGGMRRRLEIARGLMHRPEVLFLDEPTLGLDPQTRRRIWDHIRSLKESYGMTIILTTHYMDEADQLCSRVGIIDKGEIVALDSPERLKALLGGDVLAVDVRDPKPEFIEQLKDNEDLKSVTEQDGQLILNVVHGESFVPRVFEIAHHLDMTISAASVRKPNLEDVFIRLTGREIREEPSVAAKDRVRIYRWGKRK